MDNKKMNRKTYFCNDDVNKLIKDYSSGMGISESAFINICIDTYHTQKVAIYTMGNLDHFIERLDSLEKSLRKED